MVARLGGGGGGGGGGGKGYIYTTPHLILPQAFFEGKLKIAGNTALALKLQTIVPRPGKAKL